MTVDGNDIMNCNLDSSKIFSYVNLVCFLTIRYSLINHWFSVIQGGRGSGGGGRSPVNWFIINKLSFVLHLSSNFFTYNNADIWSIKNDYEKMRVLNVELDPLCHVAVWWRRRKQSTTQQRRNGRSRFGTGSSRLENNCLLWSPRKRRRKDMEG